MGDKIKEFWHDQIPGWLPIFVAIVTAAFWVGQQQAHIVDRLDAVESQIKAIQDYMRNDHNKSYANPPISANAMPSQQDAIAGQTHF
jgi:hypothetical protein